MDKLPEYLPIITTLFAIFFFQQILSHSLKKKKTYLLWWAIGVLAYGLGTVAESINILFGWSAINFKYWYIAGALLGGFPLAQGSVYLLMKRKFANISAFIITTIVLVLSIAAIFSPLEVPDNFQGKLNGGVLVWGWIRAFVPIINIYAFIFLVGGAIYSAYKYYKKGIKNAPFKGNIFIAIGGLLPGIGGTFARMGYVNILFITELLGLILIYYGYKIIKNSKPHQAKKQDEINEF